MSTRTEAIVYEEIEKDTADMLDRLFQIKNSFIEVNPGKAILPTAFKAIGEDILNLPVFDSDVWMCSFPRTGVFFL